MFLQKAKEHMGRKQLLGSLQCTNDTPEGETKVLLWHEQKDQQGAGWSVCVRLTQ